MSHLKIMEQDGIFIEDYDCNDHTLRMYECGVMSNQYFGEA